MTKNGCKIMLRDLRRHLEVRKRALSGERRLPYSQHSGHHLRDVFTTLSVIDCCLTGKECKVAEALLKSMPEEPYAYSRELLRGMR